MIQVGIEDVLAESYAALGEAVVTQRMYRKQCEQLATQNAALSAALDEARAPKPDDATSPVGGSGVELGALAGAELGPLVGQDDAAPGAPAVTEEAEHTSPEAAEPAG